MIGLCKTGVEVEVGEAANGWPLYSAGESTERGQRFGPEEGVS